MKPFTPTKKKICEICGEEFWPTTRGQRMCKPVHEVPCPICGKPVEIKYKYQIGVCCSRECSAEKRKKTNMKIWGVDNPAKLNVIKHKQAKTCIIRYGASSPFEADDFQEKRKATSLIKYGVSDPMKSEQVRKKFRDTVFKRYGVDTPFKLNRVRDSLLEVYNDPDNVRSIAQKRAETRKKCQSSDGIHFDSTYERDVYEFCLRNGLNVERQIPVEYEYDGKNHTTLIDFKIDGILFECKGGHLISGCFDYAKGMVPIDVKLDLYRKNNVVVITDDFGRSAFGKPNSLQSNGFKYANKCPYPLIGVDIELFRDPSFPYRDDRPRCFYDVRVDGKMSSHDAFFDENIRWKMIMNRIQYSGGFIDSNQILNALNISRTCKQPSWFSKEFAKSIISKYCSEDVIVDPFAGWGTRADAANELHRVYVGSDLNSELVEWHHSKGRTNIVCKDAREFKYGGKCSVFICPPYSDPDTGRCFEDYNFEGFDDSAKNLTQCQWLKIVMKNVPNASEYVMVCKVVDEGWEKYVVDTKLNKSHFGRNNEYVLVVHS